MNWNSRRPGVVFILAGLALVLAVSGGALGDAFAAGQHRAPTAGPGRGVTTSAAAKRTPIPTPAPRLGPAGIDIAFRLDPWLLSGFYGSGFWASPVVFGPFVQNEKT